MPCATAYVTDLDCTKMEREEELVFETPDTVECGVESCGNSGGPSRGTLPYLGHDQSPTSNPDDLVPTPLDPAAAFEVFHGKCFYTPSLTNLSGSIASKSGLPQGCSSGPSRRWQGQCIEGEVVHESPAERYVRLKGETVELAEELEALKAVQDKRSAESGDKGAEATWLWGHLASEVSMLQADLLNMVGDPDHAQVLSQKAGGSGGGEEGGSKDTLARVAAEEDLVQGLMRRVDELAGRTNRRDKGSERPHKYQDAGHSQSRADKGPGEEAEGVVYELYYDANDSRHDRVSHSAQQLQTLEGRLAAIEKFLLSNEESDTATSGMAGLVLPSRTLPLLEAVARVERQAALLDPVTVETMRQRLLLLKSEWEAFKRERLRLASSWDRESGSHFRRVESLYDAMERLAPVAADLPHLVSRLRVLQSLHRESLQFKGRLDSVERGQARLRQLLEGAVTSVEDVKKSLQDNVRQMEENVRSVDVRLRELMDTDT